MFNLGARLDMMVAQYSATRSRWPYDLVLRGKCRDHGTRFLSVARRLTMRGFGAIFDEIIQEIAMHRRDAPELPEDIANFARAQVSAGRFSSIEDVLRAGLEALEQRDATDSERARLLRAAWDEGQASLRRHGEQLTTESEFVAFLDGCVSESSRL